MRVSKDSTLYNPSILGFISQWFLFDDFVDLLTAVFVSQIKAWNTSLIVSKHSIPYNPSISSLNSKCLLEDELFDLLIAAVKSQIKAWATSAKASRGSAPYNPSASTLKGKWHLSDEFYWLANSCNKITNQGLKDLVGELKKLKSLQDLEILPEI